MLKNLPKTSQQLSICEANFLRLKKILINFDSDNYEYETVNNSLSHNKVIFKILQKSKHTLIIEAKQISSKMKGINNFTLRFQVCLDAKLAEVISYQGEKPIPFFLKNSFIQSKDEKIQQNRFLTEWLESILATGIDTSLKI